jgi:hypothetical protein
MMFRHSKSSFKTKHSPAPRHANLFSRKQILNEQQISPPIFLAVSFDVLEHYELRCVIQKDCNNDSDQHNNGETDVDADKSREHFLENEAENIFCWIFLVKLAEIVRQKKSSKDEESFYAHYRC